MLCGYIIDRHISLVQLIVNCNSEEQRSAVIIAKEATSIFSALWEKLLKHNKSFEKEISFAKSAPCQLTLRSASHTRGPIRGVIFQENQLHF